MNAVAILKQRIAMTGSRYEETTVGDIFSCLWAIDAPWAHPLWSQYLLLLHDLTGHSETLAPPVVYLEGATHEMLLFAVDPKHRLDLGQKIMGQERRLLNPPNHGYQFIAKGDQAAIDRIQGIVNRIDMGTVSPDTDFRTQWDQLFTDAYSLLRR